MSEAKQRLSEEEALRVEMMGKEVLARSFQERVWYRHSGGAILLEERVISKNWTWYERRGIMLKDQMRHDYPCMIIRPRGWLL